MRLANGTRARAFLLMFAFVFTTLLTRSLSLFAEEAPKPQGLPIDWSYRQVVYRGTTSPQVAVTIQNDPRVVHNWLNRTRAQAAIKTPNHNPKATSFHVDWSVSLGSGSLNTAMSPAKYNTDIFATPDCTKDFVVYTINVAGSISQANVVGFNNLYTGPTGGTCSGTGPNTYWAYNSQNNSTGTAAAVSVLTSPVLSLDGTKVAYADNGTGSGGSKPQFHVLAWQANNGGTVTAPKTATVVTTAPVSGSGQVANVSYGATSARNAMSSPYIDYDRDTAYVGDSVGNLIRVKNVFCSTPACQISPVGPSIDTTWGTNGTVAVCAAQLTGPVQDPVTHNVFVACADGNLYGFNSSGVPLTGSPVGIGDGTSPGGTWDPPMVDPLGFAYAFTGDSVTSQFSAAVQVKFTATSMAVNSTANIGVKNGPAVHQGAFNDAFFSNANASTWLLYVCGTNSAGSKASIYGITFDASGNMTSGVPTNAYTNSSFSNVKEECSPVTEFPYAGTDRLFVGLLSTGKIYEFNIGTTTGSAPNPDVSTFPSSANAPNASATETGGTSGIIIDNVSSAPQAHSIYFSALGAHTAVKLTQDTLQ
jgi:hypothetical protein